MINNKNKRMRKRISSLFMGGLISFHMVLPTAVLPIMGVVTSQKMMVYAEEISSAEDASDESQIGVGWSEEATDNSGESLEKSGTVEQKPSYINAKAAILIDGSTGQVLFEQNADEGLPPASTTKVMTALLTIEAIEDGQLSLDQKITVDHYARHITPVGGSTMALPIDDNEIVTVEDLLYGVMLKSDCVCCNILAMEISDSVEDFVAAMNERAKELGCTNTVFLNSHGFKESGHVMSAHDLALIGAEAMTHPMLREIVDTAEYTIPPTNLNKSRTLRNTNWLLGTMYDKNVATYGVNYQYEYAHGIKTGFTDEAGHCLVSYAEKDGRKLVCAILGAKIDTNEATGYPDNYMYSETIRLYDWGFAAMENGEITPDGSQLVDERDEARAAEAKALLEQSIQKQSEALSKASEKLTAARENLIEEKKVTFEMPSVMRIVLIVVAVVAGLVILFFIIQFVRRNFFFDFRR